MGVNNPVWEGSYESFLLSILQRQRRDIISAYTTSPFTIGSGSREFYFLPLVQPVIGFGPKGIPIPGGANTDPQNNPKYPAVTRAGVDQLNDYGKRNVTQDHVTVIGAELEQTTIFNWTAVALNQTLAGGAEVAALAPAVADQRFEVSITKIIIGPIDQVNVVEMTFTPTVSVGAVLGQNQTIENLYRADITNNILMGNFQMDFENGWRYGNDTVNTDIEMTIAGGGGIERIAILYNLRRVV